ncbi:Gfo/Idh/MocA family protein [Rhodococcus sp. T7]|uniref:Gfo/Idh/MocA family protein n=1 Tax=Rhodococcus sp. T7 TaxID=627444 RepID=UPI001357AFA3|nr:Gfo/Idh/MocA family oxidoreductase [Rhodococcus sp. T7]KAF0957332.1 Myo-inositol 2-dehydrogenase [Rhodococcus sp. T7]KAF0959175.1 Myo-inositol 2-dehydrogenase [Rhodococcus sp. T7]
MTDVFRIGVLGAGTIAEKAHLPGLLRQADVEIVAVCDVNGERARVVADRFGVPAAVSDPEVLFDMDIDAITCCTPNATHAELATAALEAGKHVLLEKPPAVDVPSVRKIAAAARASGVVFMPLFNHRFREEVILARRLFVEGRIGSPYYARTTLCDRRGATPGWITDQSRSGGGALIDLGVHHLDFLMYVLGHPRATVVSGSTYAKIGDYQVRYRHDAAWAVADERGRDLRPGWMGDVEEAATGLIRFDNGLNICLETAWTLNIPGRRAWETLVFGDRGGMRVDPAPVLLALDEDGYLVDAEYAVEPVPTYPDTHSRAIRNFLDTIRGAAEPVSTPAHAIHLMEIIAALYRSSATGREVTIETVEENQ